MGEEKKLAKEENNLEIQNFYCKINRVNFITWIKFGF